VLSLYWRAAAAGQYGEFAAPFWEQSMTDALQGQPVLDFSPPAPARTAGSLPARR
jgi:membrane carboxypeptidase/penicillin-binding protein